MPVITGDTYSSSLIPPYVSSGDGLVLVGTPRPAAATLVPGTLIRGAVLGQVTATGSYGLCDATQTDGRQTPAAILASVANAVTGRSAMVYLPGPGTTYDSNFLLHHGSWSDAAMFAALQAVGFAVMTRGFARN